jgi:hypothetical protein
MRAMNHEHEKHSQPCSFWRSRYVLGYIVIGAVAGYFLLTEHMAHVIGALPFLLLLACPLMHIFMHHGHGEHSHDHAAAGTAIKKEIKNARERHHEPQ